MLSLVNLTVDHCAPIANDGEIIVKQASIRIDPPKVEPLHPAIGLALAVFWVLRAKATDHRPRVTKKVMNR
jgi:hypothetical protein